MMAGTIVLDRLFQERREGLGLASEGAPALKTMDERIIDGAQRSDEFDAATRQDDFAAQHYRAIVESSEDAILSKDLSGVILSWNLGAERLFGYTAEEAVGRPVTLIIPLDRQDEEPVILGKIRNGERITHFETVRQRKDGNLVDISLTISPIRNPSGEIVGASKIARDIGELRKARDRQQLLLREMSHRVKNLFALSGSIVGLSARSAKSVQELAQSTRERLSALARAHALTFSHGVDDAAHQPTTLKSLVGAIVAPFDEPVEPRITISGIDAAVSGSAVSSLALLLHEFATNATKYGALSSEKGTVEVVLAEERDAIILNWTERGGPSVQRAAGGEGFGDVLSRITIANQLDGQLDRDWRPEGLAIRLSVQRSRLTT